MTLILDGVSKQFGGLAAVSDVSMSIPRGRITGLIGPNGAGKTTLVNLITGILALSGGTIKFDGVNISAELPHVVARRGISRTFQNIRLLPEATALDNIVIGYHRHEESSLAQQMLGLARSRNETKTLRRKALTILDRFKMAELADLPAGRLSYGHQRRLEIMRAVASDPRVLILDEPVAGMNDVEASQMGDIFLGLAEDGVALLLIEHNVSFVSDLCREIYVLDSGRMIASGSPQQVMQDPIVRSAYLGTV